MAFQCPHCQRPLVNRRRGTCGYCGGLIPAELLLSDAQQSSLDKLKAQDRRRHAQSQEDLKLNIDDGYGHV